MVCGRGELAERERLPRDGEPQRRLVGGSLVRVVRCIARSNQIRWALELRRHLDADEETGRSGGLSCSLTATGHGRSRGCWSGRGSRGVCGGRLHHRGWRHVGCRGRITWALRVVVVVIALSATEARKAAHLPFPSAPPRGGDPVDAGRAAGARASDEPMTQQGQECWARTHEPSRRPPSLRADHAPASQHRRGVSTSWNAMPELAARAPNETRPAGAEQGSVTRLVVGCSGDRRGAQDHHETRRRSMAMAMEGRPWRSRDPRAFPEGGGTGGGHRYRWRGGGRRGMLSLARGVNRGAPQNKGWEERVDHACA